MWWFGMTQPMGNFPTQALTRHGKKGGLILFFSTERVARGRAKYFRMLLQSETSMPVSVEELNKTRSARTGLPRIQHFKERKMFSVPVVDKNGFPLMPTSPRRAARWVKSRKATPFWSRGVWCIRLNVEPLDRKTQPIAVGIDPGSKREAFTVKSKKRTFLNILTHAVHWVKDAVEARRNMRKSRRSRKTPCRAPRFDNRKKKGMPPSTLARWQWKLRVAKWISRLFPISDFVVEDIKAKTRGQRKWDFSFSPLEIGKKWFYEELNKIALVTTKQGWETKTLRDELGLKKTPSKLAEIFSAHNVDSWILARSVVGEEDNPDNKDLLILVPLQFHRRQLHAFQPSKGGIRRPYGGTRSLEFKRGSLVEHPKHKLCYIGGSSKGKISLHSLETGTRISQNINSTDLKFINFGGFRFFGRKEIANSSAG